MKQEAINKFSVLKGFIASLIFFSVIIFISFLITNVGRTKVYNPVMSAIYFATVVFEVAFSVVIILAWLKCGQIRQYKEFKNEFKAIHILLLLVIIGTVLYFSMMLLGVVYLYMTKNSTSRAEMQKGTSTWMIIFVSFIMTGLITFFSVTLWKVVAVLKHENGPHEPTNQDEPIGTQDPNQ